MPTPIFLHNPFEILNFSQAIIYFWENRSRGTKAPNQRGKVDRAPPLHSNGRHSPALPSPPPPPAPHPDPSVTPGPYQCGYDVGLSAIPTQPKAQAKAAALLEKRSAATGRGTEEN